MSYTDSHGPELSHGQTRTDTEGPENPPSISSIKVHQRPFRPSHSMTIQAKLVCESVTKTQGAEAVKLRPVTGDSPENKTFSKYTPSGSVVLDITNPAAFGAFVPGAEYLTTFEPATKPAA